MKDKYPAANAFGDLNVVYKYGELDPAPLNLKEYGHLAADNEFFYVRPGRKEINGHRYYMVIKAPVNLQVGVEHTFVKDNPSLRAQLEYDGEVAGLFAEGTIHLTKGWPEFTGVFKLKEGAFQAEGDFEFKEVKKN